MQVISNNTPRDVIYGYELDHDERKEFDYLHWVEEEDDGYYHPFFRYKGELYDLEEFEALSRMWGEHAGELREREWDGICHDSFFSGIVIKYVENFERVIVGRYYV